MRYDISIVLIVQQENFGQVYFLDILLLQYGIFVDRRVWIFVISDWIKFKGTLNDSYRRA